MNSPAFHAVMAAAFILVSYAVCAQESLIARKLRVRSEIEHAIRTQYDWMISQIKPGMAADQVAPAVEGLKSLAYMKAYALYTCAVNSTTQNQTACLAKYESALRRHVGLSDYGSVIPHQKQLRCEMQSRLFDAEAEFPPFEFLKSRHSRLLDFQKFFDCMTGDK